MGGRNRRGWLAVVALLGGCSATTYVCADDDACPGGACEADGFCSFPDPDCPTGRRYGEFSGPGAGACVGEDGGDTGTSTTGSSTSTSSPTAVSDTASGETTSPQTATGSPTGEDVCGGNTCYPAPPAGWTGPVRLVGDATGCEAMGGSSVLEAASSYSGDWACDCECDLIIEAACSGAVQIRYFDNETCTGAPIDVAEIEDECASTEFPALSVMAVGIPNATCSANGIDDHGPIAADDAQVLCDVPPEDTCEGRLCLPSSDAPTCVFREGETECPDEVYTARTVVYQSSNDDRRCSECSCSAEGGCAGLIEFRSACGGGGGDVTTVDVGECASTDEVEPMAAVRLLVPDESLQCVDEGGEPDGSGVTAAEPVTTCCVP